MAQPTMTVLTINPSQAAWDATINDQFEVVRAWLEDGPLPIPTNTGPDPTVGQWDQCIWMQWATPGNYWLIKYYDGTTPKAISWADAFVATLGQVISDPPTQGEVQDLSDKMDELIGALRDGFSLLPS